MIESQLEGPQPYSRFPITTFVILNANSRIVKTDEYILKKYRGHPPSLIIHLHAAHFRFDQHEGSFSYKSPMKMLIEHLRLRTVPHDLFDFFATFNVPFYDGCMIVQVHDHKSTAFTQEPNRAKAGAGKTTPFSIHNYNAYLTPSPYVSYPTENQAVKAKSSSDSDNEDSSKSKTSEQKDKENMPAPAFPMDGQRGKSGAQPKKPKISTIVLHPTSISDHVEFAVRATDVRSGNADGRESRPDANANGPLSATMPPTPNTAIPSTPITSMAPPAKRLKKSKVELDSTNYHALQGRIVLATTAPLSLEPVSSASESAALLDSLAHPMHMAKPPSPKTRKRTVAELAADEALAAEQERFMLVLDERLSNTAGVQAGANPADGDGQAGGASFEPRFERFKTLENIRNQHEENKKAEKARQQEAERKSQQDRERERLRLEAEKRDREKAAQQQMAQAAANQQNEAARRAAMAARSQQQQQSMQGIPSQTQGQHAHPQPNGVMGNGIQAQNRFHQQQASQTQISSPIVRNNTPQNLQNHSSPMGNIPMQNSTSSMGGSPPRPGSAVHQNHPQISGAHGMTSQRSQQSHAGTPRMPNATPNMQSTPLTRPMSQTPRISQASPLQGPMAQTPNVQMMAGNGPVMNIEQQRALQQRMLQQRQLQQMQQNQAMQAMGGMNGQPLNQQQFMQQQMMRAQQQGQIPNHNPVAQNYAAQLAAMGPRPGGMPANMNMNINGSPGMTMQQMQQIQQMQQLQQQQQQQAQAQAHAHAQAQAQAQAQQHQQPMNPNTQMLQQQMVNAIRQQSQLIFQGQLQIHQQQYPGGNVPDDVVRNIRMQADQQARASVQQRMARQRQMMAQGGLQPNGMQNGMGMQRQQGM